MLLSDWTHRQSSWWHILAYTSGLQHDRFGVHCVIEVTHPSGGEDRYSNSFIMEVSIYASALLSGNIVITDPWITSNCTRLSHEMLLVRSVLVCIWPFPLLRSIAAVKRGLEQGETRDFCGTIVAENQSIANAATKAETARRHHTC